MWNSALIRQCSITWSKALQPYVLYSYLPKKTLRTPNQECSRTLTLEQVHWLSKDGSPPSSCAPIPSTQKFNIFLFFLQEKLRQPCHDFVSQLRLAFHHVISCNAGSFSPPVYKPGVIYWLLVPYMLPQDTEMLPWAIVLYKHPSQTNLGELPFPLTRLRMKQFFGGVFWFFFNLKN